MQTKESLFAKMCDKLETDIQSKLYCEEGSIEIQKQENQYLLEDKRIQKLLEQGAKSISDLFIEIVKIKKRELIYEGREYGRKSKTK